MSGTTLILPTETLAREFDGKLLLGCVAATRGFRVIVGGRPAIHGRLLSLPRSIYLSKDLRAGSRAVFDILGRLGHLIVGWDEEALVYPSTEIYYRTRVSAPVLGMVKRLFAWGPENERVIRAHPAFPGMPVDVTGNPRFDMMRPELRGYFAEDVAALRARYGDYVLVSGNFGFVNHYFPKLNKQREDFQARKRDREAEAARKGLVQHRHAIFRRFLAIVPRLAEALPERTIVLRPHPSENLEPWREAAAGFANVVVENQGNAVPWLLAARCMIHNSCTTGVEAAALGVPGIAYRPLVAEGLDLKLPNAVSHEVFDEAELVPAVRAALAGDLGGNAAQHRRELLGEHVAALEGPLAAERIVEVLEAIERSGAPDAPVPFGRVLSGHLIGRRRQLVRLVRERLPDSRSNRGYLRHKFPGMPLDELRRRIGRLQATIGGFEGLRVRAAADDVFELTA